MGYYKQKDRGRGPVRKKAVRKEKSAELSSEPMPKGEAPAEAASEPQPEQMVDDMIDKNIAEGNALGFKQAFANARAKLGAGQSFTWRGKQYTTDYREESAAPSMEEVAAGEQGMMPTTAKAQVKSDVAARTRKVGP